MVIHTEHGVGEAFKFLGPLIDVKLRMDSCVDQVVARARPKVKALLRTRAFYNLGDMLGQYKAHIWGITEYVNGCILHACATTLDKLERLQRSFLNELQVTEECAFIEHNFAPPALRRDIGILGMIHKRVLGECHPAFCNLLPFSLHSAPWHDKQINSRLTECVSHQA